MVEVKITRVEQANLNDPRGPIYEWCKGLPGMQLTIYERKKGISLGNHYHKGEDPSKNPEILFLAKGEFKLVAYDKQGRRFEADVQEGQEIKISPYVLHALKTLTDIILLEYRSNIFNKEKPDTYLSSLEDFLK
jgi:oxalate decarboxylase/phosphoglucose isomerase-like protein (cupin superfamily)